MSLASLSTEIDENIISRLDKIALNNLSLTSKYYRALCEPHLYRDLTFSHRDSYGLNCLFLTILDRPELALHVRAVVIKNDRGGTLDFNTETYEWLLNHTSVVRELVRKVAAPLGDAKYTLRWFDDIYAGALGDYVASLALILCMATNLKYLDLGNALNGVARTVLGLHWFDPKRPDAACPFHKLKTLCLRGGSGFPLLPGLEEQHLDRVGCDPVNRPFYSDYSYKELGSNLRVLTLRCISFNPQWIEGALQSGKLQGLKELRVQLAGSTNGWTSPWSGYDMSRISKVIVASLQDLEVLEWSQHQWDKQWGTVSHFGSFSDLKQLISLTVDYQLLVQPVNGSRDIPLHLLTPHEYLPAGLKFLHLTDVMKADVRSISDRHLEANSPATAVNFIANLVTTLPLMSIGLSLPMGSWHDDFGNGYSELPRCMRKLLPQLIEALNDMGVVLKVWRQSQVGDQAKAKLLYEPGYEAPWPQLQDIHQDEWAESAVYFWKVKTGLLETPPKEELRSWELEQLASDDEE